MGPLVAAGLALTQGNLSLFHSALSVCGAGILLRLSASLVFGVINPGFEGSEEIEARGKPDVLDLVVAFASGMVAAYAMGRPNVSGTLAKRVGKKREGQARPTIYPVSAYVRNAVWEYIGSHPELNLIMMARNSREPDTGITLLVTTTDPLKLGVKDSRRERLRSPFRAFAGLVFRQHAVDAGPEVQAVDIGKGGQGEQQIADFI